MQVPEQRLAAALIWDHSLDMRCFGITMDHPKLPGKSWKKGFAMSLGIHTVMWKFIFIVTKKPNQSTNQKSDDLVSFMLVLLKYWKAKLWNSIFKCFNIVWLGEPNSNFRTFGCAHGREQGSGLEFAAEKFVPILLKQKIHLCGGSAGMLLEEAGGSDRPVSVAEGIITPSVRPPFLSKVSVPVAEAREANVPAAQQRSHSQLINASSCKATWQLQRRSRSRWLLSPCFRVAAPSSTGQRRAEGGNTLDHGCSVWQSPSVKTQSEKER